MMVAVAAEQSDILQPVLRRNVGLLMGWRGMRHARELAAAMGLPEQELLGHSDLKYTALYVPPNSAGRTAVADNPVHRAHPQERIMTTSNNDRYSPRQMLAAIALSELPPPCGITLYWHSGILSMSFDCVADAEAWTRWLDGYLPARVHSGRRWADYSTIQWHGWTVQPFGSEPTTDDGECLDAETTGALAVIATGGVT